LYWPGAGGKIRDVISPPGIAPPGSRRLGRLIGLIVGGTYLAHVWSFVHVVNDDAYITFRYSLNLAAGVGPYFNAGEHVEGYTNFLLMLLVAAAIKIGGADFAPVVAKAIGVLGGLLAMLAARAWTQRRLAATPGLASHAAPLAWIPALMIAVNAAFALNTVTGLETALFAGLLVLGLAQLDLATDREEWHGAGVALALAALTRPEGAIAALAALSTALAVGGWRRRGLRRAVMIDLAIVAAVVAAHVLLRLWLYDGEWLPNTYYAKTGGPPVDARTAGYLWGFAAEHLGGPLVVLPLMTLVGGRPALLRASLPGLTVGLCACAELAHTGPDWMLGYRPLVQYLPVWCVLAVFSVAAVCARISGSVRRAVVTTWLVLGVTIVALLVRFDVRRNLHRDVANSAHGYAAGHRALADWLHTIGVPDDTVALMDIGLIGFCNPALRILDISGLTDRHIARSPGALFQKQYDPAYVLDQRPRFIVLIITRPRVGDELGPFVALTPMEGRIANHPRFRDEYFAARAGGATRDDLERLAALLGAVRVFDHADPKHVYLLAIYQRR
jgi:hypothetical protein